MIPVERRNCRRSMIPSSLLPGYTVNSPVTVAGLYSGELSVEQYILAMQRYMLPLT